MYWSEDRMRAVRLYIKLGKRASATIRQLGYPTKNALSIGIANSHVATTCREAVYAPNDGIRMRKRGSLLSNIWATAVA